MPSMFHQVTRGKTVLRAAPARTNRPWASTLARIVRRCRRRSSQDLLPVSVLRGRLQLKVCFGARGTRPRWLE